MDDDESVRSAISSLVRSLGYRAAPFESAEAFLASSSIDQCSCLISDVRMPGMNGIELRGEILRAGRTVPIILITAFATDQIRGMAEAGEIAGFLEKPFESSALVRLLSAILPVSGSG